MYPNIDAERARKNWSTAELAQKLGVCRKTYYNWLARGKIPEAKLKQMCVLFNATADYLLGLDGNNEESQSIG